MRLSAHGSWNRVKGQLTFQSTHGPAGRGVLSRTFAPGLDHIFLRFVASLITIRVLQTSQKKKCVLISSFIYYLLCARGGSNLFPSILHEMWNVLNNFLISQLTSRSLGGVSFVETCASCSAVAPGLFISHYLFNLFASCPHPLLSGDGNQVFNQEVTYLMSNYIFNMAISWVFGGCLCPAAPNSSLVFLNEQ